MKNSWVVDAVTIAFVNALNNDWIPDKYKGSNYIAVHFLVTMTIITAFTIQLFFSVLTHHIYKLALGNLSHSQCSIECCSDHYHLDLLSDIPQ